MGDAGFTLNIGSASASEACGLLALYFSVEGFLSQSNHYSLFPKLASSQEGVLVRAASMPCFAHNVALQLQSLLEFYFLGVLTQQAPISAFNFSPLFLKSEFPDLAYVSLTTLPICCLTCSHYRKLLALTL